MLNWPLAIIFRIYLARMKAYLQGDKIVIRSNEEYVEIESLINSIAGCLDLIKAACEDRNAEAFPSGVVRKMVEKVESLKTKGKDIFIGQEFVKSVVEGRDVYKYFEESLKKAGEEEEIFLRKMELYRNFADRLEEIL